MVCTWFLIGELGVYLVVTWLLLVFYMVLVSINNLALFTSLLTSGKYFCCFYVVVDLVLVFTWLLHVFYMIFTLCVCVCTVIRDDILFRVQLVFTWLLHGFYMVFTFCSLDLLHTVSLHLVVYLVVFLVLTLFLAVVFLA